MDLQLGFKLGLPGAAHLAPNEPFPTHIPPRNKTPARKAKDKARAAAHQQQQLNLRESESVLSPTQDPHLQLHQQGAVPAPVKQQAAPAVLKCSQVPLLQTAPVSEHHPQAAVLAVKAAPASDQHPQAAVPAVKADPASSSAQSSQAAPTSHSQAATAGPNHLDPALQDHLTAVPAHPLPEQATHLAASAVPTSKSPVVEAKKDPELVRKKNILINCADRITMSFANNRKIGYSGCQGQIEDEFWKILNKKPLDFFHEDKLDDDKVYKTYKSTARSLGVRIW